MQTLFTFFAILVLVLFALAIVRSAWHNKRIREDLDACGLVAVSSMYEPPEHLLSLEVSFTSKNEDDVSVFHMCVIRGVWEEFDDDYREELLEAWYFERYGEDATPCIQSELET